MANYNTNLKRNKAFVGFLNSLKPGWSEIGGRLLRNLEGEVTGRTQWLPQEEWWQVYVAGDKAHLKESEISEVAAIVASGEDCQLTASALRFLSFIADYYSEQTGKKINSRKMRLASCSDNSVIAVIGGEYLEFTQSGLTVEKKPVAKKAVAPTAPIVDCPF